MISGSAGAIRRLDQVVADAIAAGEVVERPASVVKELVENALDAGARSIQVEIDGGGLERILVVDDGSGIKPEDLELAFTRHATSKLSTIDDLGRIASLGFRGEALASIAAVSRVDCRSCCRGEAEGARITIDHGRIGAVQAAPPVPGTRVEVRGLFENTPARRAFLRRPATELGAAVRVLSALALCNAGVRMRLSADGRRVLDLPGDATVEAVYASLGRTRSALLPVEGERGGISVTGVVVEPEGLRRSREHLYLAINGRPVSSRSLAFAVEQAYRGLAEPGLFPAGALMVELAADAIDVNVHPTKREVKLRDERTAFAAVQEAVVRALSAAGSYGGEGLLGSRRSVAEEDSARAEPARGWAAILETVGDLAPAGVARSVDVPSSQGMLLAEVAASYTAAPTGAILRGPFRLVGQVMDSYIVAEGPSGLVLVDQHAAHERIVYNRLVATAAARQRQPLLVPILLHLTPVQAACLEDCREDLALAGLEVEDFGSNVARLVAYDPVLPERRLDRLTLEVIDTLVGEGGGRPPQAPGAGAVHGGLPLGGALRPAAVARGDGGAAARPRGGRPRDHLPPRPPHPAGDPGVAPPPRVPAQPRLKPLAIVGSTAVGKTAVAIGLARRLGGEIVSFDSRQVYRGIEVSSNAPTAAELGEVRMHLVGILDPQQDVTAASYVGMARAAMAAIPADGALILTAGTGMYLKAYLDGLDLGGMGAVAGLREQLEAEAERDLPGLARRLQELSPGLAAQTDLHNPMRVVRRMELLWAAAMAADGPQEQEENPRVDAVKIGLRVPATVVEAAIAARIDRMLEHGWREEVEALVKLSPPPSQQVMNSIGLAEMVAHIDGEIDEAELRARVLLRTRQYAKRQRTWFRADPEVRWIDAGNRTASDIVASILEMLA